MGSLFSANGRKFPPITEKDIDDTMDEYEKELRLCHTIEEQKHCEENLWGKTRNPNHLLEDFLTNLPVVNTPTPFGMYCLYQLVNIFLEQSEKEQKNETDMILREAEAIKNGKA